MHCFSVPVQPNAELVKKQLKEKLGTLSIQHMEQSQVIKPGSTFNMMFALIDPVSKEVVPGLQDVKIRAISTNNWFHEEAAVETKVPGVYHCNFKFENSGVYYLYVECLSRDLKFNNPQYLVINVIETD